MTFIAAFDAGLTGLVYDLRLPIALVSVVLLVVATVVAYRLGWFAAARRHPWRTTIVAVVTLAVVLPIGVYTVSPLFIRSTLVEDAPIAVADVSPSPSAPPTSAPTIEPSASRAPTPSPIPTVTPFAPSTIVSGAVRRHRRLPLRIGHGLDHRDRSGHVHAPTPGLLGPQRSRPVRLPLAGCGRVRG